MQVAFLLGLGGIGEIRTLFAAEARTARECFHYGMQKSDPTLMCLAQLILRSEMSYYSKGSIIADSRDEAKVVMVITSGQVQFALIIIIADWSLVAPSVMDSRPSDHEDQYKGWHLCSDGLALLFDCIFLRLSLFQNSFINLRALRFPWEDMNLWSSAQIRMLCAGWGWNPDGLRWGWWRK